MTRACQVMLLCMVLLASVAGDLFTCAAPMTATDPARASSVSSETRSLHRLLTSTCDARQPEHQATLGQAPSRTDGAVAISGAMASLDYRWVSHAPSAFEPLLQAIRRPPPAPPPRRS